MPLYLCVSKKSHRPISIPCADFGNTEAQSSQRQLPIIECPRPSGDGGYIPNPSPRPSVPLYLCVSKKSHRPSTIPSRGLWKHGGTEFTETAAYNRMPRPSHSVPLRLCVSNPPLADQFSWQTFCHASNLADPKNFHNRNGTTWALRISPKLRKFPFQKIHNVFNPNTLELIVNDAWIEPTGYTSAKSLKIRELPIAKTGFSGSGSGFAGCERDLSKAACCRCCVETLS